jgi:hypothetical protein
MYVAYITNIIRKYFFLKIKFIYTKNKKNYKRIRKTLNLNT